MKITRIGVDIAKSVFHICGVDRSGKILWQGKYPRARWLVAIQKKAPEGCEVGMEACGSSHHWGRELQKLGYHVKLLPAQFVKPYVKTNKNDRVDAAAIAEAMSRPGMRFVSVKSVAQQDAQAKHRIRDEIVRHRTAKANQIRGLVNEYGLIAPTGLAQLRVALPRWLEDAENGLTDGFRATLADLAEDFRYLDKRVKQLDAQIKQLVIEDPVARRLLDLGGVGSLTANALSVALADHAAFSKGRDFAASLGLTPRQHSTGGKARLLGISKRGDSYLRKLLVHGARAVIQHAKHKDDNLSQWINHLVERKHVNVVTIALANKTARAAWAMIHRDQNYQSELIAA